MSTSSQPVSRSASNSSEDSVVIENHMPFSRWFREIGWRHVVGVIALVFAAFPVLYVIAFLTSSQVMLIRDHTLRNVGIRWR